MWQLLLGGKSVGLFSYNGGFSENNIFGCAFPKLIGRFCILNDNKNFIDRASASRFFLHL